MSTDISNVLFYIFFFYTALLLDIFLDIGFKEDDETLTLSNFQIFQGKYTFGCASVFFFPICHSDIEIGIETEVLDVPLLEHLD